MKQKYGIRDLFESEGVQDENEFVEEYGWNSTVPAICKSCGWTAELEPDIRDGMCDKCDTQTVVSGLVLLGLI